MILGGMLLSLRSAVGDHQHMGSDTHTRTRNASSEDDMIPYVSNSTLMDSATPGATAAADMGGQVGQVDPLMCDVGYPVIYPAEEDGGEEVLMRRGYRLPSLP